MHFERPFGRLGTQADLDFQIAIARRSDAKVTRDDEAGTVEAVVGDEIIFRAIAKGGLTGRKIYLIMYSQDYYSKTYSDEGHY